MRELFVSLVDFAKATFIVAAQPLRLTYDPYRGRHGKASGLQMGPINRVGPALFEPAQHHVFARGMRIKAKPRPRIHAHNNITGCKAHPNLSPFKTRWIAD